MAVVIYYFKLFQFYPSLKPISGFYELYCYIPAVFIIIITTCLLKITVRRRKIPNITVKLFVTSNHYIGEIMLWDITSVIEIVIG